LQGGIEPILARALDKNPDRRYQRARDMAADLSKLVTDGLTSESLNETISLSSTMLVSSPLATAPVTPATPAMPVAPPAKAGQVGDKGGAGGLLAFFGRRKSSPAAAPGPPIPAGTPAPAPAAAPPLPPPAASPGDATGGTDPGTVGSGTAAQLSATVSTGVTPLPAAPAPVRSRPRHRALWGTALLLLVVALAAGGLWLSGWRPWSPAPPPPAKAAVATAPAVPLPPVETPAQRQQREAAARAAEQAQQLAKQKEIDDHLSQARQALTSRHYDEAVAAASAALALSPGNADAQGILTAAEKAESRRLKRAAQATQSAASSSAQASEANPPQALQPAAPAPTPVTPVPTEATLSVNFFTNLPEGVLVVYVNNNQRMREPFNYREKTGFLRSRPSKGWVRQKLPVPVGTADIRVYVTYENKRTEVKELSGNFPGGTVRTLNVTLNEDGSLSARLE
ncbi:MAG TPA: hypothetical protein VMM92_11820, partial [Thermoanaerobaculia bacterium]|nr:hypothetical protein [Thermoanaerobaculia bacterium]